MLKDRGKCENDNSCQLLTTMNINFYINFLGLFLRQLVSIMHLFKSIFFDLELTIIVGLKLTIIVDNINPLICLRQLMSIKCQFLFLRQLESITSNN